MSRVRTSSFASTEALVATSLQKITHQSICHACMQINIQWRERQDTKIEVSELFCLVDYVKIFQANLGVSHKDLRTIKYFPKPLLKECTGIAVKQNFDSH